MINIRRGVFETNSSSSHSIVVRKPKSTLGFDPPNADTHSECGFIDKDGKLHVFHNDFGWGFSILSTWVDKMLYALAEFRDNREEVERIIKVMQQGHPEFRSIDIDLDDDDDDDFSPSRKSLGHIDHQSKGILRSALEKEGVAVEDLIDDSKYVIIIDNDNTCYLHMIASAGLLDKDSIDKQYG